MPECNCTHLDTCVPLSQHILQCFHIRELFVDRQVRVSEYLHPGKDRATRNDWLSLNDLFIRHVHVEALTPHQGLVHSELV